MLEMSRRKQDKPQQKANKTAIDGNMDDSKFHIVALFYIKIVFNLKRLLISRLCRSRTLLNCQF